MYIKFKYINLLKALRQHWQHHCRSYIAEFFSFYKVRVQQTNFERVLVLMWYHTYQDTFFACEKSLIFLKVRFTPLFKRARTHFQSFQIFNLFLSLKMSINFNLFMIYLVCDITKCIEKISMSTWSYLSVIFA